MDAENQLRRIELLEQQVSVLRAEQAALLQRQVQFEARLESRVESFRSMLQNQLLTALREQQAGIAGKTGMELGVGDFELSKKYCTNLVLIGGHPQEIDQDQHNRQLAVDRRETMHGLLASNNTAGDHEKHESVAESIVGKIKDKFHGNNLSSKSDIIVLNPLVCSYDAHFDVHRQPVFWKFVGRAYFDYLRFKFKALDVPVLDTVVGDVKGGKSRSDFDADDVKEVLPRLMSFIADSSIAWVQVMFFFLRRDKSSYGRLKSFQNVLDMAHFALDILNGSFFCLFTIKAGSEFLLSAIFVIDWENKWIAMSEGLLDEEQMKQSKARFTFCEAAHALQCRLYVDCLKSIGINTRKCLSATEGTENGFTAVVNANGEVMDTIEQVEFGVFFLLFTIGLELSLERVSPMKKYVFGLELLTIVYPHKSKFWRDNRSDRTEDDSIPESERLQIEHILELEV